MNMLMTTFLNSGFSGYMVKLFIAWKSLCEG